MVLVQQVSHAKISVLQVDNEKHKPIDIAVEPESQRMLRSSQIETLMRYPVSNKGKCSIELRVEGLPINREPEFLVERVHDLLDKVNADAPQDVRIPIGPIDHRPYGYAVVRFDEKIPKNYYAEVAAAVSGQLLLNEKRLTYRTRDKFLNDIKFREDLKVRFSSLVGGETGGGRSRGIIYTLFSL